MDQKEKALARILFENKIRKSDGQAFENLFVAIMQNADQSFTPIKAQGKIGDKKNDGYIRSGGIYYQVFAPEDIRSSSSNAVKKLKEDFEGLKAYWDRTHPIKEFFFVINDKYYGSHPIIERDLEEIRQKYALDKCEIFLAKNLENVLFSLPDDIIMATIGFIPELNVRKDTGIYIIPRIYTGKQLLGALEDAYGYDFDVDGIETQNEVELSANFLRYLQDLGDILGDLNAGDRVELAFELNTRITELEQNDLKVFGTRQLREFSDGEKKSKIAIATIRIVRQETIQELEIMAKKWDELMKKVRTVPPEEQRSLFDVFFKEWDDLLEKTDPISSKENETLSGHL